MARVLMVAFVFLMVACGGGGVLAPTEVEVTRIVTVEREPKTVEVEVTREVIVVVTSTPEPSTATPVVPPTVESSEAANKEYLQFVTDTAQEITDRLNQLNQRTREATNDVSLLGDEAWLFDTMSTVEAISSVSREIIDREAVPLEYQDFHNRLIEVAEIYLEAMTLYVDGIEQLDGEKLVQFAERLGEAGSRLQELGSELIEFGD